MTVPQEPVGSEPRQSPARRRVGPGLIVGLLLLVLVLIFIFENTQRTQVRLIGPKVHTPLLIALLVAAVLGSLATLLLQLHLRHRRR